MPALPHPFSSAVVEFERRGGRFIHSVGWSDSDARWRSLEAEPEEPWPSSPPLQDLLLQEQPSGATVALLVGQAGKSHWSLSVEPLAEAGAFRFDVACRVQAPPPRLGSGYQVGPGLIIAEAGTLAKNRGTTRIEPTRPWSAPATLRWAYVVRLDGDC